MKPKFNSNNISDCNLIDLKINHEVNGNLTVIENEIDIPFEVKRIYYLYDVPGGSERGGHAHKELEQFIIAASGSFEVEIFDGFQKKSILLNSPNQALHIIPGIWREIKNFSSGSICLVHASLPYDEKDYIRSLNEFINWKM